MWTHNDEIPFWRERIEPLSELVSKHFSYTKNHNYGSHVEYMPLAADTTSYYPFQTEKKYDVCLVGAKRKWRCQFTDLLAKRFPKNNFSYAMCKPVEEINKYYAQSRVIVAPIQDCDENVSGKAWGCPCRTFDVRGAGAYQLEVNRGGLSDVYPDADTIKPIQDVVEAADVWGDCIEHMLANPDKMKEIADNDYQHTLNYHTYAHRAQQFVEAK